MSLSVGAVTRILIENGENPDFSHANSGTLSWTSMKRSKQLLKPDR